MELLQRQTGKNLHDVILGGQDGLVNVLGIVLGVATATLATESNRLILVAGLAAAFAESVSMAAVAYTSTKAEHDFLTRARRDHQSIETETPLVRRPGSSALIVGLSSIIGSLIPLLPFFWFTIPIAALTSVALSAVTLFALGAAKAHLTIGRWYRSGLEIMAIGLIAAFLGYLVGVFFRI